MLARKLAAIVFLAGLVVPHLHAEPRTYNLTPVEPKTFGDQTTAFTVGPGSVTVAVTDGTSLKRGLIGTMSLSVTGPSVIEGEQHGSEYVPSPLTNTFTFKPGFTGKFSSSEILVYTNNNSSSTGDQCGVSGSHNTCSAQFLEVRAVPGGDSIALKVTVDLRYDDNFNEVKVEITFLWRIGADPCVSGACVDLAIDHIETIQVVQAWDPVSDKLSVPMSSILGMQTRVFLQNQGSDRKTLSGIWARREQGDPQQVDAVALPGTIYSFPVTEAGKLTKTEIDFATIQTLNFLDPEQFQVWLQGSDGQHLPEATTANNTAASHFDKLSTQYGMSIGLGLVCTLNAGKVNCPHVPPAESTVLPIAHERRVTVILPRIIIEESFLADPGLNAFAVMMMIKEFLRARNFNTYYQFFTKTGYPESETLDQMIFIVGGAGKDADEFFGQAGGLAPYWWVRRGNCVACPRDSAIAHGIAHNLGLEDTASPSSSGNRESRYLSNARPFEPEFVPVGDDSLMNTQVPLATQSNGARIPINVNEFLMLQSVLKTGSSKAKTGPLLKSATQTGRVLVISGWVSADGSTGALDPGFAAESSTTLPSSNPSGNTCLRITPSSANFCFDVRLPKGGTKGYFAVALPFPAGSTQISLQRSGRDLASLRAGTAPQIAFTAPVGGESWSGVQTVRWTGSAPGLLFQLDYSPDDGTTWFPLSPELSGLEYQVDTATLAGGSKVRFRLMATSGLETSTVTSGSVQIPQNGRLSLDTTALDFGNRQAGTGQFIRSLTLTNSGTSQLLVPVGVPSNPGFAVINQSGFLLEPGESADLTIGYTPSSARVESGTVLVGDQTVTLRGNTTSNPAGSLEPEFSPTDLGQIETAKTKTVSMYLRNRGSADISVTSLSATGSGFSVAGPTGTQAIPAGGALEVQIRYTAGGAPATATGTLVARSTDPGQPQLVVPLRIAVVAGAIPISSSQAVVNAASFMGSGVAPGEIVTLFTGFAGPSALAGLQLDSQGYVAASLAGTRVLFNGIPAPIIYTLASQVSVVVPYGIAGAQTAEIVVEFQGRRSDPFYVPVVGASPGLFSANSSGTGQGAILNQNGSPNSSQNPAAKGSVIVLYGTGEGSTDPIAADGSVVGSVLPKPRGPVKVTIGGVDGRVLYAGAAPGLVAGVLQVNVEIAANTPAGNQPVIVTVGAATSQTGLTVAIESGGTSPAPKIVLEPASLSFTGQTRQLTVTVRNTGTATLSISRIDSSNLQRFSALNVAFPLTIGAGLSQGVTIQYSPASTTTETATLTFVNNDATNPNATLPVTGAGTGVTTAPKIVLEPASLSFTGQTRQLAVTVRNTGAATLSVSRIDSSNLQRFSALNVAFPLTIGAGLSQGVTIQYSPASTTTETGTITFVSNDPTTPSATLPVTGAGTGVTAAPKIGLEYATLDFGIVSPATAPGYKDIVVKIRNDGTANLTVSRIDTTNSKIAAVIQLPPLTAGPGSFQFTTIRYTPTNTTGDTATLTFVSNDPAAPNTTLTFTGNGGGGNNTGGTTRIPATTAAGWPNGRTSNQIPALAIDGSTGTYTWTTESGNTVNPAYLNIGFAASTSISRIRLYKDNDAGGPGLIAKNLTIEYTTSDPSIPLPSRTWTTVSGLANGFNGAELLTATAVNANGTVTADNHNSLVSGFASLTFNAVNATGVRIGFSNATPLSVNHYRVYEFEAYGAGTSSPGVKTIAFGQTVTGTLSASSDRSVDCPPCFADVYTLTVPASRTITITLNSTAFDAYLNLLSSTNQVLGFDDDSGGGLNAKLVGTISAGTYRIEVTSAVVGATGAYTLSIAP